MNLIGWVLKTGILAILILFAANTVRVDRRTLNTHFLTALEKVQLTDSAQSIQRGVTGWLKQNDMLSTSKSQATGNTSSKNRNLRVPEPPAEDTPSAWERRELEKILRE